MNKIIRVKSEKGFTIINNAAFNSGLSLRAIGLLTFIIHLPDDWVLYKKWLYKNMQEGRDAINGAWSELEQKGFIKSEPEKRSVNGKFAGINHIVYDMPVKSVENPVTVFPSTDKSAENPLPENPVTENPLPETRQLLNTNIQRTKEQSTNVSTDLVPVGTDPQACAVEGMDKTPANRLPTPDDSAEIKKERARYEAEIYPSLLKMPDIDAKRKLAEYIQTIKPPFYEPYTDLWNYSAPANGLAKIKKLSHGRELKVKARLKDPDFDFIEVMKAIKKSAMLKGDNERGWKVDFDFIFKNDTNYLKIVEGKYQ
jgi:hypothetical protein